MHQKNSSNHLEGMLKYRPPGPSSDWRRLESANGGKESAFLGLPQIILLGKQVSQIIFLGSVSFSLRLKWLILVTSASALLSFLKVALFFWMQKRLHWKGNWVSDFWISNKHHSYQKVIASQYLADWSLVIGLFCFVLMRVTGSGEENKFLLTYFQEIRWVYLSTEGYLLYFNAVLSGFYLEEILPTSGSWLSVIIFSALEIFKNFCFLRVY